MAQDKHAEASETVVIVGGGHAAGMLAFTLRQKKYDGRVLILAEEPHRPYQRPPLSKAYLAGESKLDALYLKPEHSFAEQQVELQEGVGVEAVDRAARRVQCANGETVAYDRLVLATGSQVRRLPVPGAALAGVHYLRGIADADALRAAFAGNGRLVIVGAGYIGLEVAAIATKAGLHVTVLEAADRVMQRVTGPQVSAFFADKHRSAGVDLRLEAAVSALEDDGSGRVAAVTCADGSRFAADVVLVAIGIAPRDELAREAGLACDDGILVNEHALTDDPNIFAIGDCTRHRNLYLAQPARLESVANAVEQARVAAATITGAPAPYDAVPWFWSDQYHIKLQTAGIAHGYDETVVRGSPSDEGFGVFYLRQGKLVAVDAVNQPRIFMASKKLLAARTAVDPGALADPSVELASLMGAK